MFEWSDLASTIDSGFLDLECLSPDPGGWADALKALDRKRPPASSAGIVGPRRRFRSRPFRMKAAARTMRAADIYRMSDDEIYDLIKQLRWPRTAGQPQCPKCLTVGHSWISTRRVHRCSNPRCRYEYSLTTGTIWQDRRLSLRDILEAAFHFAIARTGLSAMHLSDIHKVDGKTAHIMLHKFRESIASYQLDVRLGGIVEMDGLYFGGSWRRPNLGRKSPRHYGTRTPLRAVLTLAERGGPVVAVPIVGENRFSVNEAIERYVLPNTTIVTDLHGAYSFDREDLTHLSVNHAICFAVGSISTNNAESYHARIRACQRGAYRRMASGEDFDLYLHEIAFRHSMRETDTKSMWMALVSLSFQHPVSERFVRYWQGRPDETVQ